MRLLTIVGYTSVQGKAQLHIHVASVQAIRVVCPQCAITKSVFHVKILKLRQTNTHANQPTYLQHAKSHGKQRLIYIIHPTLGWLGAFPDTFIIDPHYCLFVGIVEFKCPYSNKELTPS